MKKITDLKEYRNKNMLFDEIEELTQYLHRQSQGGTAIHEVEQGIWDKLLIIGKQALGQFIASQGDGELGKEVKLSSGKIVKRLAKKQARIYRSIFGNN